MKFKFTSLKPRLHNIFFHLHTVSGITITALLFVIFLAGAFTLFRGEFYSWENPKVRHMQENAYHLDSIVKSITSKKPTFDTENSFRITLPSEKAPFFRIFGSEKANPTKKKKRPKRISFYLNPKDLQITHAKNTTLGNTIYHLHYFRQIPKIGMYLSSSVAFLFLFAMITGILIHWKNMRKKFFAFIFKGGIQKTWTNLHTFLGVLGLPFQFIYAITGAYFGLRILFFIPFALVFGEKQQKAAYKEMVPARYLRPDKTAQKQKVPNLQKCFEKAKFLYPESKIQRISVSHYGYEDAFATYYLKDNKNILSKGSITYNLKDATIKLHQPLQKASYIKSISNSIIGLHFANFSGISLKILYFLMAILTCFMLIGGLVIWEKSRDNNHYTKKQKRFHYWITKISLAICLSLFSAIALFFLINKCVPLEFSGRVSLVQKIFFIGWLLLALVGCFFKKYPLMSYFYIVFTGIIAFFIPIANGIITGDWFWKTFSTQPYVFAVDIFWFLLAFLLLASIIIRRKY